MPDFPAAVPLLPPLESMSQDDILALFDRLLPQNYLAPLKEPGPGYEYLQAVAKMVERASTAIANVGTGCYIGSATGGSYATATVELYRDTTTFGAVMLYGKNSAQQGTLVGTDDGYTYELVDDVFFAAGDLGPKLALVRGSARGWLWNRPGPFTTDDGEYVPGPINQLVLPVVPVPVPPSIPNFDPTIMVRQVTAATGGSCNMLDGLGNDRGLPRSFAGIRQVTVARSDSNPGVLVLMPGSVFATDTPEWYYRTTTRVDFPDGETGVARPVSVLPLAANEQRNTLPLSQVISPVWGSSVTGTVYVVSSPTPAIETDLDYRTRLTQLPVTVTPNALRQVIEQIIGYAMSQNGVVSGYRETWDVRYQSAYDFPFTLGVATTLQEANLSVSCPEFYTPVFVYDYVPKKGLTTDADPLGNRYLGSNSDHSSIVLYLPTITLPNPDAKTLYPGLAAALEQVKPAGAVVLYVTDPP